MTISQHHYNDLGQLIAMILLKKYYQKHHKILLFRDQQNQSWQNKTRPLKDKDKLRRNYLKHHF